MKKPIFLTCVGVCLSATALFGQGGPLDPADLLKPLTDNWTSYSGDDTGRRYSFLKQVAVQTEPKRSRRQAAEGAASEEAVVAAGALRHRSSSAASATVSPGPTRAVPPDSRAGFWW
jgi:hypothetical protein